MRVVCISDFHNQLQKVKPEEGNLLLIAGDATFHADSQK
jgi:hypothetical protein